MQQCIYSSFFTKIVRYWATNNKFIREDLARTNLYNSYTNNYCLRLM